MRELINFIVLIIFTGCAYPKRSHLITAPGENLFDSGYKYMFLSAGSREEKYQNHDLALDYFYKIADTLKSQYLNKEIRRSIFYISNIYTLRGDYYHTYRLYQFVRDRYYYDDMLIDWLMGHLDRKYLGRRFSETQRTVLDSLLNNIVQEEPYISYRKDLETGFDNDQRVRNKYVVAQRNNDTLAASAYSDSMDLYDTENLGIVTRIFTAENGWPDVSKIGRKANRAIFLIIQHSDEASLINFYPQIRAAYDKKKISGPDYALYMDRYMVYTKKKQIYGTQYYYDSARKQDVLYPLKDPAKVNLRRAEAGLDSLSMR